MDAQEFAHWRAVTESSTHRWVEDEIHRLNGRGLFYYTGGEDGIYMEISEDGRLAMGIYEGAIPHIGEAFFSQKAEKQCADKNAAFQLACQYGGKKFMMDLFSDDIIPQFDESKDIRQSEILLE